MSACTSVDVKLQERSQGTICLSCRLIATILSLLILYDLYGDSSRIWLPVLHCSGRHKEHQQHPSLAQLLLERLFIFFSWLLGHKEESQAKQTPPCWAHHISVPRQVYRLWIFLWPRQHQPLSQEQFGAQAYPVFICKTLGLQSRITTYTSICTSPGYRSQNPKLQNNREDQKGP